MTEITPALIERLRSRFPRVDVNRIADEVRAQPDVNNPAGMLTWRCKDAGNIGGLVGSRSREATEEPTQDPARVAFLKAIQHPTDEPTCANDRARVYVALLTWLWSHDRTPDALETAVWLDTNAAALPDRELLVDRLRNWPDGDPYPPLPDDAALAELRAIGDPYGSMPPWERTQRRNEIKSRLWYPQARVTSVGPEIRQAIDALELDLEAELVPAAR